MFKVTSISITGFWQSKQASSDFRDDVNIIIGRNGTGKTTFMNILHAVLAVDTEALYDNAFRSVHITLSDGKRTRTIRADRAESSNSPFPAIEYHISNRRFVAPLFGGDESRTQSPTMRRRALEEAQRIKFELNRLVSVASLSVYRIGGDPDPELRERVSRRYASTVDVRLASLMQRLTQYQLELSNQARLISSELQRDVLTSLLYSDEKAKNPGYTLDFDETAERQKLISAYRQLGVSGQDIALGYSMENSVYTHDVIHHLVRSWCKSTALTHAQCAKWLGELGTAFAPLIALDIANAASDAGAAVLTDNCTRFMTGQASSSPCPIRINAHAAAVEPHIPKKAVVNAKKVIMSSTSGSIDNLRGHLLATAVLKFLLQTAKSMGKKINISMDALYAAAISNFARVFGPAHPHHGYYSTVTAGAAATFQ